MAEGLLQVQNASKLIQRIRRTLYEGGGSVPATELPVGVSGRVAVRGRRRADYLDSRHARDTRFAYGVDRYGTEILVTGRYTSGPNSEVAESNILMVDNGRGVTGTNILVLNKPSWKEPLVVVTSDPTVVVASLSRLVRNLAAESLQMKEGNLVAYDASEFARD